MSAQRPWYERRDTIMRSNLPPSDKAGFRCLLDKADYATAELPPEFTPTQKDIARQIRVTVLTVKRAMRHLERHGWLQVTGTTGPGKTRRYTLTVGTDCDCTGRVHEVRAMASSTPSPSVPSFTYTENEAVTCDVIPVGDTRSGITGDTCSGITGDTRSEDIADPLTGDTAPSEWRVGDPVPPCQYCGADGIVGVRLVEHEPDCWRAMCIELYDRER